MSLLLPCLTTTPVGLLEITGKMCKLQTLFKNECPGKPKGNPGLKNKDIKRNVQP